MQSTFVEEKESRAVESSKTMKVKLPSITIDMEEEKQAVEQRNYCSEVLLFDQDLFTRDTRWYRAKLDILKTKRIGANRHQVIEDILRKTNVMQNRLLKRRTNYFKKKEEKKPE